MSIVRQRYVRTPETETLFRSRPFTIGERGVNYRFAVAVARFPRAESSLHAVSSFTSRTEVYYQSPGTRSWCSREKSHKRNAIGT